MGIDSMRVGGGRCPPLLVGGLLVACLMLICNWWTLSSENIELVRQIDELNEQFKISTEERDQCVALRGSLEQKFKHAKDEIGSLHIHLQEQGELKRKNVKLEGSVNMCNMKLDLLKKLNDTKSETLEAKQDENKHLQEEIVQLKDEIEKIKLSCNKTFEKKSEVILQSTVINKTQLRPVPDSAVKVSVAGQRGLKYHGIPILPKDPPGAVRLSPRLSVVMLKAQGASKQQKNHTSNAVTDQEVVEGKLDEFETSKQENQGFLDGNVVESDRDRQMIDATDNEA